MGVVEDRPGRVCPLRRAGPVRLVSNLTECPTGKLTVATATDDAEAILRQMALIRRELHEDVREVVASAEAVADWHRYIRMYPWASVGLAFAIGYLIVPKRKRPHPIEAVTHADLARVREAVEDAKPVVVREEKPRKSLLMAGLGMLVPMAWRLAQNYVMNFAEQWLAQQQERYMMAAAPPPPPPSGSPRSTGGPGRPGGF